MKFKAFFLGMVGVLALTAWGCKTDAPVANTPPETRLFVNEFKLTGENRLQSLVHLHWYGEDKDGIVVAYEISTDNNNWARVTVTDSVFRFNLSSVADTADIDFFVRAIDDKELRDPTPASLRVPIKNTPPVVRWDSTFTNTDTVLALTTLQWQATDADGDVTIRTVRLKANDGEWLDLPPTTRLITIVPDNPKTVGVSSASIYISANNSPERNKLQGLNVGGNNRFYLQAVDIGNLTSKTDTSKNLFFARQSSDVLLLDAWQSSPKAGAIIRPILSTIHNGADYIDMIQTTRLPVQRNITFPRLFGLYKQLYWVAELSQTQLDIIESSEATLQNYLNNNGKLFMYMTVNDRVDSLSSLFRYTPMERLTKERNGLIQNDQGLRPEASGGAGYPVLINGSGSLITEVNPFSMKASAVAVYEADLIRGDGATWTESKIAVAKLTGGTGKTNMIFGSVPIHLLNKNNNLNDFFTKVKQEFDW